ncbi:Cu,Zn superoxide dismutase-like protein [Pseudovirgaria hyperparasitica]|uniref:superoxide dismutase n=1 Tax=Pseudovirgaria hyperparasitica TaxID=470096 RepID=A0A6A6WFZ4_9PEZI|nr:Cu,Zn superoxide dismutase-like protein [Pseudovirgaria hyperparasitica]KAF2761752.1 Cu,Zn superoxide dismutase-like protein [Pseudovirgaria hyperparasitica]
MRSYALISALLTTSVAAQTTGKLGDAAIISDNPVGAHYVATFPISEKNTVRGTVKAESNPDGKGVHFEVSVSGLPEAGGPWGYHLHAMPVPEDGNCTKTLAHLDPYERGNTPAAPKCDKEKPETCEVGDLSGKHGAMSGTSFTASYDDQYASLKEGIGAFFGNRSIVIHYSNSTRITCANFTMLTAGTPASPVGTGSPSPSGGFSSVVGPNGTAPPTGAPTYNPPATPTGSEPSPSQGAGSVIKTSFGFGALLAGVVAFVL